MYIVSVRYLSFCQLESVSVRCECTCTLSFLLSSRVHLKVVIKRSGSINGAADCMANFLCALI